MPKAFIAEVKKCPKGLLAPEHFREDGLCKCLDLGEEDIENLEADVMRLVSMLKPGIAPNNHVSRDLAGTLHVNLCALEREVKKTIEYLEKRYGFGEGDCEVRIRISCKTRAEAEALKKELMAKVNFKEEKGDG